MQAKRSITAILALAGTLVIGTMALAQNQNPQQNNMGNQNQNRNQAQVRQNMMNMMCPIRMFPALPQQTIEAITPTLGLTASQQAAADQMFTALRKRIDEIRGKSTYTQNLMDEMKSAKTDPDRVNALATAAMKQEEDILKAELQTWMEFEKILNTDQQTALWNMMLNPQRGMTGMRGQGQGMRAPGQGQRQGGQRNNQQNRNQNGGQMTAPPNNYNQ